MQGLATALAGAGAWRNNSTHHENHGSQPVLSAVDPQRDPTISYHVGSSSAGVFEASLSQEGGSESLFSIPGQEGVPETDQNSNVASMSYPPETSNWPCESGN